MNKNKNIYSNNLKKKLQMMITIVIITLNFTLQIKSIIIFQY